MKTQQIKWTGEALLASELKESDIMRFEKKVGTKSNFSADKFYFNVMDGLKVGEIKADLAAANALSLEVNLAHAHKLYNINIIRRNKAYALAS
jgi:hypothetical protein